MYSAEYGTALYCLSAWPVSEVWFLSAREKEDERLGSRDRSSRLGFGESIPCTGGNHNFTQSSNLANRLILHNCQNNDKL